MAHRTYYLVKEFHETYRAAVGTEASLSTGFEALRLALVTEETLETFEAFMTRDEVEYADGLGDLDYVIEGAAITFGMVLDAPEYIDVVGELEYPELLGHLLLGVRFIHEIVETEGFPEDIESMQASLSTLKAIVWEIADRDEVPLSEIIEAIHESNMSKLGADGMPIFREDMKVLKGPNYFTPTAKIKEILGVA